MWIVPRSRRECPRLARSSARTGSPALDDPGPSQQIDRFPSCSSQPTSFTFGYQHYFLRGFGCHSPLLGIATHFLGFGVVLAQLAGFCTTADRFSEGLILEASDRPQRVSSPSQGEGGDLASFARALAAYPLASVTS